jgi:tRNA A-37 threonylcarbamoyl transferase component Bud32
MSESREARLSPGTMVGAYRIERHVGAGGVGTVYAAIEPVIKKRVAIKVLKRSYAEDAAMAARFEREARAANEIHHPGIVDVFAIGALPDGRPYLVMSLLEGRSLRAELSARERLPPAEAWRIVREVAEALAAAHDAGVVHRDLKPDNVFLERFGAEGAGPLAQRVRLLDFGIAKVQATEEGDAPMKLTATGVPIGTPAYMSPEQWWCQDITARTDQYALGVMLFEALAGRPPFASAQFVELVQQHVHEPPPRLSDVGIAVAPAIQGLLDKALAKSADDRFASMRALIEAGDRAFASGESALPESPPKAESEAAPADVSSEHGPRKTATATVDRPVAVAVPRVPARPLRRYLVIHAAIVLLSFAAIVAVGYAGEDRHDVGEWVRLGGWGQYPILGGFGAAVIAFVLLARRRAVTGETRILGFWLALFPALSGAFSTYTSWSAVIAHTGQAPELGKFTLFNRGMYEANATRFLGFSISAILFVSLSAIPGISGLAGATTTLSGALGVRRRESVLAAAGLAVVCVAAGFLGAPSGALIAGVGAAVLAVGAALPTVHTETAARDEIERAVAGLMAVGLAIAAGITRLEAREAALWFEPATRAVRVAEIVAAHAERTATLPIAVASLAGIALIEALRIRRLHRAFAIVRPRPATAALILVLACGACGDVIQHGRFIGERDELRAQIAAQFALFARLDPPSGDALDPSAFAPRPATALQVAREVVAVNAKGVARLAALSSPDGAAHVAADLNRTLAKAAVEQAEPGEIDLSVSVDREVNGGVLLRLLQIARSAGVRRIEFLLTRGQGPRLAPNALPETGIVIPSDFVALPAELGDQGLTLPEDKSFGQIAPELIAAAVSLKEPLRFAVASKPSGP